MTMIVAALAAVGPLLLAERWLPFLRPLPVDDIWLLLLVPLVLAIAVVYKTIKLRDLSKLPRQAAVLTLQIVAFMILAAVALWLITELL